MVRAGEDRQGTVPQGHGLSGLVDGIEGGLDLLDVPGTGDGGLGRRGRLVAAAGEVQDYAGSYLDYNSSPGSGGTSGTLARTARNFSRLPRLACSSR